MTHYDVSNYFGSLVMTSPRWIVALVGIIVAVVNWSKYPRPAMLILFGCLLTFCADLTFPIVRQFELHAANALHRTISSRSLELQAIGILQTLCHAASLALMIAGGLSGRSGQQANHGFPLPPPQPAHGPGSRYPDAAYR